MKRDSLNKYLGWIVAIAVGAIYGYSYLTAPVEALSADVADVRTELAVHDSEIKALQILQSKETDDISWIREAIAAIGAKEGITLKK